jgi:hypothetical protein
MQQFDVDYHQRRARQELDLGLTANMTKVAQAHLKLASLHMQRLREAAGNRAYEAPLQM